MRLDPRREAAWRKLGYRKHGNRWMTDAQIAAVEDQKKSERIWLPQVKKIHKDIHGSNGAKKRDLARAAFEAIHDEKAIPSLYREFGGNPTDQLLLIQALDRIDTPLATKVLAMLAVYGQTPEVRRRATELLRGRPSQDYLELLVDLMVDPFKYEVKPVGGPGSPGMLFVEGEKFNMARFYAPPPPPNVVPQPGDIITYDRFGMPGILRHVVTHEGRTGLEYTGVPVRWRGPVLRAADDDGGPESGRRGGGPARGGRRRGQGDQRRPPALLRAGHRGRGLRDGQGQGTHTQGVAHGREGREGGEEIWRREEADGPYRGRPGIPTRLRSNLLHESQGRRRLLTGATLAASGPEASPPGGYPPAGDDLARADNEWIAQALAGGFDTSPTRERGSVGPVRPTGTHPGPMRDAGPSFARRTGRGRADRRTDPRSRVGLV